MKLLIKLLVPLLLIFFTDLKGQKTTFIIKEGNTELQNKIGSFTNQYMDGVTDGTTTADSKVLTSYLDLRNLEIGPENDGGYLQLKFKKEPQENVIISSAAWLVSFESLDESTTKVRVELWRMIPGEKSAKFVIAKKSKSTGKFENEIKIFLEN